MARFLITDETAAAERMSSDPSSNWQLGSGTAPNRLCVSGTPFATANGVLGDGRVVSDSVSPTVGTISSLSTGGTAVITHSLGRQAIVTYEEFQRQHNFEVTNPNDGSQFCDLATDPAPCICLDPGDGTSFTLINTNSQSGFDINSGLNCVVAAVGPIHYVYI
jgi:hypothetical protein